MFFYIFAFKSLNILRKADDVNIHKSQLSFPFPYSNNIFFLPVLQLFFFLFNKELDLFIRFMIAEFLF